MIKVKGNLLMFDKPDLDNRIFPKDCKINMPDVIPISLVDKTGECLAHPIGHIISTSRNETCLTIDEGVIIHPNEEIIETVIKENNLYFGGHFIGIDMSEQNNTYTYNSLRLLSVGLYLGDQFGDESLKVEIIKEE
jgi:hypothetical protein